MGGGNPGKNLRRRHFFFSPPPIFLLWRCPKLGVVGTGGPRRTYLISRVRRRRSRLTPFLRPSLRPVPLPPNALLPFRPRPLPLLFLPACQANGRGGGRSCGNLSSPPSPFLPRAAEKKKKAHSGNEGGGGGHQQQPPRHLEKLCPETVQCEVLVGRPAQPFSRNLEQEEEAAR